MRDVDRAVGLLASLVRSQLDLSTSLPYALSISGCRMLCHRSVNLARLLIYTGPTAENLFSAEFCKRVTGLASNF